VLPAIKPPADPVKPHEYQGGHHAHETGQLTDPQPSQFPDKYSAEKERWKCGNSQGFFEPAIIYRNEHSVRRTIAWMHLPAWFQEPNRTPPEVATGAAMAQLTIRLD